MPQLEVIERDEEERTRLRYTLFGEKELKWLSEASPDNVKVHENITNRERCVVRL